jgi:hypothetical protein
MDERLSSPVCPSAIQRLRITSTCFGNNCQSAHYGERLLKRSIQMICCARVHDLLDAEIIATSLGQASACRVALPLALLRPDTS